MTLTTRLTVFFLTALAIVLAGFGITLYLLARIYLHRQLDERLQASLNLLVTAAEQKPYGIEWEGPEHLAALEREPDAEPSCWCVWDDRGQVIDHSRRADLVLDPARHDPEVFDPEGRPWRTVSRRLESERYVEKPPEDADAPHYRALEITTALPLWPAQQFLRQLAIWLGGVSLGVWLVAAFTSRTLCRRALKPVRDMASAARAMHAADLDQRLPVATTGDELSELGQAFNDLLARLHESFQRQAQFTGDASHQLRTPLTALLGQIEIALRHPRDAAEYRQVLTVLHEQARQLRQIIDSLLFLARADAQAASPSLEPLDLRAWLTEYLDSWSSHPRAEDLILRMQADCSCMVRAQVPLLRQLLDNLLDNASKYSAPGTPITVELRVTEHGVSLSVADAGCGIAQDDMPHLFEAFYRSAEARRQGVPGLGLGLAIAQRIAKVLGGTLDVQSWSGKGTRFTLRLPVLTSDHAQPAHTPQS
jgi:heavy metal sensor kinase